MEAKFNVRNPAVKRIMQEMKEMANDESVDFMAEALQSDIFEWHFVIRGAPDTEFEGGIYHGRILLPAEYPFKPPSFMMLTPSGRFETATKICLSMSSHHPEHWQPSWSVRTALTALIAFMPSPGAGAVGSLDFPKEERIKMAAKARVTPPSFGSPERQELIKEMHTRMLARLDAAQAGLSAAGMTTEGEGAAAGGSTRGAPGAEVAEVTSGPPASTSSAAASPASVDPSGGDSGMLAAAAAAKIPMSAGESPAATTQPAVSAPTAAAAQPVIAVWPRGVVPSISTDVGLTLLAGAIVVAIAAILLRRLLAVVGRV